MSKLLIVSPNQDIYRIACDIVRDTGVDAQVISATSSDVVEKVRREFQADTGVALARGHQAQLLKNQLDVPVIEIIMSVQDMAVLMHRAAQLVQHPVPRIAFVGFRYMFSNCDEIAAIMQTDLRICYASTGMEVPTVVARAAEDGAEVIVGGEIACRAAREIGLPALFMDSARESILMAVRTAVHTMDALRQEQRRSEELSSLLNYSFNAVLRLDSEGRILTCNAQAEKALHITLDEYTGVPLLQVPQLHHSNTLKEALESGSNMYAAIISAGNESYVANISTIRVEDKLEGFILSMQDFGTIDDLEGAILQDRRRRGYIAHAVFQDMHPQSALLSSIMEDARRIAQYDVPVLLQGPAGLPKAQLAQCIHNASMVAQNPYVAIDLSAIPVATQTEYIFGKAESAGYLPLADKGTLFLLDVHLLTEESQHQLLNVLRHRRYYRRGSHTSVPAGVRVICSTYKDLQAMARDGHYLEPLAATLSAMTITLPAIADVPEEIPHLLSEMLDRAAGHYKKHVSFTEDALELLCAYTWPGNVRQIQQVCERLTILANDYRADADFVCSRMPALLQQQTKQPVVVVADHEEAQLRNALRASGGNRNKAAQLLGVSRSTLWRRMVKYGLET